jgi:rod shape-determining protein MreD
VKLLKGILALVAALLGQLTLSAAWPASVIFFDLPLLVVLYYGLDRGPAVALTLGAGIGLIQDSLTGSLLGAGAVSRSLVGFILGSAGSRFVLTRPLIELFVIAGGTLTARLLELLTLTVMGRQLAPPSPLDLLAAVAGNAAAGWIAFRVLHKETSP